RRNADESKSRSAGRTHDRAHSRCSGPGRSKRLCGSATVAKIRVVHRSNDVEQEGQSVEGFGRQGASRPTEPLRIALVSPPMLPIPPARYAGTERIVAALVDGLHRRGHRVTLFAPGDSRVDCELVPTVPRSLWSTGFRGDLSSY